jgi:hypothetical protein
MMAGMRGDDGREWASPLSVLTKYTQRRLVGKRGSSYLQKKGI